MRDSDRRREQNTAVPLVNSIIQRASRPVLLAKEEAEITQRIYADYRNVRKKLFQDLCRRHSNRAPTDILQYTQTILNRILFITFAEDRGLLPRQTLIDTCDYRNEFRPAPTWTNFCLLFERIYNGNEDEGFITYDGSLFEPNTEIDELEVADELCAEFKVFAKYDYCKDVSVDVLGHIFEQSISDLDELRGSSGIAVPSDEKVSPRKADGIFYTPVFVTRYVVDQTLGRLFEDRWQTIVNTLGPPVTRKEGSPAWVSAWIAVSEAYLEELKKIRVLDLSCGAGAFLMAAFDAFSSEYDRVNGLLAELGKGQTTIFDRSKTIFENNLFGVDVNAESVEITKLSLWLKTAERGRKLTYLDSNIKWGNSIVGDPMVHSLAFDWATGAHVRAIFDPPTAPEAAEINARWREGFDVVIGNPPYVRHELLGTIKPHLETAYRAHHGMADLFVYFFERGISVLKPGGRLGFVVANKWLRGGYAEPLRKLLASETTLETLVDFGHAPIFPDADAFPCILTLVKRMPNAEAPHDVQVTMFPREELHATEIPDYVARHGYAVPQNRLGATPWSLEPPALDMLMAKIRAAGVPLTQYAGVKPYRGILTGFNDAFIIDTAKRNRLVAEDPKSAEVIKKHLRGQDIERWAPRWNDTWLIQIPSSGDRDWPWKGLAEDAAESRFALEFPAIHKHLKEYEDALRKRTDQGRYWWELRSCAYYEVFEKNKIIYQEIQFHPAYAFDVSGLFVTNKVFILPTADTWLLTVCNSPLMWWFCWRYLPHMKTETLSPTGVKMEALPIASPSSSTREQAEAAVTKLIALKKADDASRAAVLDSLRLQYDVTEAGNKLTDFAQLDIEAFVKEVLKRRPKSAGKLKAADLKSLREMYGDEALPMQARGLEALGLERQVGQLVNDAYGLTAEDVALLWNTAPPRMPFKAEAFKGE
ncbi:MAG TPA: Eco57I restriction-modification methylase domain-containing protein [Polyangium sp.]|nr:Eco57I restriction-modification methylase domain-containing protein [Polyangium sp.]